MPESNQLEAVCKPLYGSTALFAEDAHGTCPFYLKIGACRHGDQCSRHHVRPTSSQTLLLQHLYPVPQAAVRIASGDDWTDPMYDFARIHLEEFYDECFAELASYGEIEDLIVADNVSEHMLGNIYVKYFAEEDAEKALQKLTGKFYAGRLIKAEFSPVTDFREARCRAFHEARCNRGGYCNFLHIKHIPRASKRRLVWEMYEEYPHYDHKKQILVKDKKKKKKDDFPYPFCPPIGMPGKGFPGMPGMSGKGAPGMPGMPGKGVPPFGFQGMGGGMGGSSSSSSGGMGGADKGSMPGSSMGSMPGGMAGAGEPAAVLGNETDGKGWGKDGFDFNKGWGPDTKGFIGKKGYGVPFGKEGFGASKDGFGKDSFSGPGKDVFGGAGKESKGGKAKGGNNPNCLPLGASMYNQDMLKRMQETDADGAAGAGMARQRPY